MTERSALEGSAQLSNDSLFVVGWSEITFRIVHLIRGCQSSAGLAMSSNLLHSCSYVQQLLVREIFPLGMSDGTLPIRDLTFPWANRFADAGAATPEGSNQADSDGLIYFSTPALGQNLVVEND
jgi:hypothetical protein